MAGTRVGAVLQPRDLELLRALDHLRVVDREAAKVIAPFGSTTRANTRLQTLTKIGLLVRHPVGTIAGGHKYLYALSAKGARVANVAYRPAPWTPDTLLAGSIGLEHQLRLNALYLMLMYKLPSVPGVRVRTWRTFQRPVMTATPLIPDAYVEVDTPSGGRGWFVELDRGTESRRTWAKKATQYVQYATSGAFARPDGPVQFGVLVIAPSLRRVHSLRPTLARTTTKLFWLASYGALEWPTFWRAIWWRPVGDAPHSLIPARPCAIAPAADA